MPICSRSSHSVPCAKNGSEDSDAGNLFEYAKDPDVGPIAGWPAHQSIEESRNVIRNVLCGKEAYAICLKTDGKAILYDME